jgi:hypothetical protein
MSSPGAIPVDPMNVFVRKTVSARDIAEQVAHLRTRGQVEPIVLENDGSVCEDREARYYAAAQVMAARQLGWPTILVTYEKDW